MINSLGVWTLLATFLESFSENLELKLKLPLETLLLMSHCIGLLQRASGVPVLAIADNRKHPLLKTGNFSGQHHQDERQAQQAFPKLLAGEHVVA